MMLIVSLGFLACLLIQDALCIACFALFFLVYLYVRFKNRWILILFIFLALLSMGLTTRKEDPTCGEYQIVEIKKSYYIAQNCKQKILVYSKTRLNFQDRIQVYDLEPIHTDDNFTLFSFTDYNRQRNITYQTRNCKLIKASTSLKARLYNYMSTRKNAKVLLSLYYGIHDDTIDQIYTTLGYGYISAYYFLLSLLKRRFPEQNIRIFFLGLSLAFGFFFVYTLALIRLIAYQLARLFFTKKENQIGFTILLFGLIQPFQVLSISFVLPLLLQLVSFFCTEKKWIVQKMVLVSCLFIYFKKVDVVSLCFFSFFKKVYGLFFLTGFFLPDLYPVSLPSLTLHYAPGPLFLILFLNVFIQSLRHFQWKYLCIIAIAILEVYGNPFFQVYTLNIGQGDCSLIVEPFQKSVVMIDCGQSMYRDNVESIIYPFLENKNIHCIDTLILTHADMDHSGGYEALNKKIKIKQVVDQLDQKVNVSYPFYTLLDQRVAKDENDRSIISYFTYDDLTYLFMGDASQDIEKQLLENYDLKCDVLKVGHHGSNTSSSFAFLEALDCKVALISAGYKNKYNHPSVETLKNLKANHINALSTNTCGSIGIYSLSHFSFFITNDGMFGIISI